MFPKNRTTERSKLKTVIYITAGLVLGTLILAFGLCVDLRQPCWILDFYDSFSPLGFDVIIELISLVFGLFVPHIEDRARDRFFLSDEDFEIIENKNRRPVYLTFIIFAFVSIFIDLFAYLFNLKFLMICLFIADVLLLFYFMFPNLCVFLFPDKYIMRRIRLAFNYCVSEKNQDKFSKGRKYKFKTENKDKKRKKMEKKKRLCDFFTERKDIVYRAVNVLLIKYDFSNIVDFFMKKKTHRAYDRNHLIVYLTYIHCEYIYSVSVKEQTFFDENKMSLFDQFKAMLKNLNTMSSLISDDIENLYNSITSPIQMVGRAFSYLDGMILKYENVSSTLHVDLFGIISSHIGNLDRAETNGYLKRNIRFLDEFFIESLKYNFNDPYPLINSSIISLYGKCLSNDYLVFLGIFYLCALYKDNTLIRPDKKDKIYSKFSVDLTNLIYHYVIDDFNAEHYASLLLFCVDSAECLNQMLWGLVDSTNSVSHSTDYFFEVNDKLIYLWWFFILLIASENDESRFNDTISYLDNEHRGYVLQIINDKENIMKTYFKEFQTIFSKICKNSNVKKNITIAKSFNSACKAKDRIQNDYETLMDPEGKKTINIFKPFLKQICEVEEFDKNIECTSLIPQHIYDVRLKKVQHVDNESYISDGATAETIKNDILHLFFSKNIHRCVNNRNDDFCYPFKIKYDSNMFKEILKVKPTTKSLGYSSNGFELRKDGKPKDKTIKKVSKLEDAPVYLTFEETDMFYSTDSIKFNIAFDLVGTYIRPLTSKEIQSRKGKLTLKNGNYEYNGMLYSENDIEDAIRNNEYVLRISCHFGINCVSDSIAYYKTLLSKK